MKSEIDDLEVELTETDSLIVTMGEQLADAVGDTGYSTEEQIQSLVQAIVILAAGDDGLLDMAANFLADGGSQ